MATRRPDRELRSAGTLMADVLRTLGGTRRGELAQVAALWESVAEDAWSGHTVVRSFRAGKLMIEVASPALRQELAGFRREELLTTLRKCPGGEGICGLDFRLASGVRS